MNNAVIDAIPKLVTQPNEAAAQTAEKLTAEIREFLTARDAEVEEDEQLRHEEAEPQSEINGRMTPTQKETVGLAPIELEEASDVEIPESPTPSAHSTNTLLDSCNTSPNELPLRSRRGWTRRVFLSSAVPMGKYVPGKHPMTGLSNPEPERRPGCLGSTVWFWNWRVWREMGCGLRRGGELERIESFGS